MNLIQNNEIIKKKFKNNRSYISIKIIDFKQIISETFERLKNKETSVIEMTEIGRFLQILQAAELDIKF